MATRTTKRNTTDDTTPADLAPVELDPPNPAIARWEALTAGGLMIHHGGNAEKIIPRPRPAWAQPDCDETAKGLCWTSYNSDHVYVPTSHMGGESLDGAIMSSGLKIRGRYLGDGFAGVGITMCRYLNDKWQQLGTTLTLDEARALVDALTAAINMIGETE